MVKRKLKRGSRRRRPSNIIDVLINLIKLIYFLVKEFWYVFLALGIVYLIHRFIIKPIIDFYKTYPLVSKIIAVLIIVTIGIILFIFIKKRINFEKEQKAKGLIKYKNIDGKKKWGTPKEAEKATLFNKVMEEIKEFEPSQPFKNEIGYHAELHGWLRKQFPQAHPEKQIGASRPDIVIKDIAIEVKGPTDDNGINSLPAKCIKYSRNYKKIIIVLFNPKFSERNYREIMEGIKEKYSHVYVIKK